MRSLGRSGRRASSRVPAERVAEVASGRVEGMALALVFVSVLLAVPVHAEEFGLSEAKQAGELGERFDGYIGVVRPDATPELLETAQSLNRARKAHYADIAARNGTTLSIVELLAARSEYLALHEDLLRIRAKHATQWARLESLVGRPIEPRAEETP